MGLRYYKKMIKIIFVLVCVLNSDQLQSQITNRVKVPGKCYAKLLKHENPENLDTTISIFYVLADDITDEHIHLKQETFLIDVKSELWIRAYKNSSYNVLWELDKQSVGTKTIQYLNLRNIKKLDPTIIDTIQIETCQIIPDAAIWREVICEEDVTNELLEKIALALIERGYELNFELENSSNKLVNSLEFKEMILQFQKDYGLYQGAFTIETLKELEVTY